MLSQYHNNVYCDNLYHWAMCKCKFKGTAKYQDIFTLKKRNMPLISSSIFYSSAFFCFDTKKVETSTMYLSLGISTFRYFISLDWRNISCWEKRNSFKRNSWKEKISALLIHVDDLSLEFFCLDDVCRNMLNVCEFILIATILANRNVIFDFIFHLFQTNNMRGSLTTSTFG